jgi:hypothetical protein
MLLVFGKLPELNLPVKDLQRMNLKFLAGYLTRIKSSRDEFSNNKSRFFLALLKSE